MTKPINDDAKYISIIDGQGKKILIDVYDIARIGVGETVQLQGIEGNYKVALIDWKAPFSNQWQMLIDDYNIDVWNEFCTNQVQKSPKNDKKSEENVKNA